MDSSDLIPASEFCLHHNIEVSFIHSLRDHGMIETVKVDEALFLPVAQLDQLERIIRLHFELDINLEGIETISHLLERMKGMREQVNEFRNRLKRYED